MKGVGAWGARVVACAAVVGLAFVLAEERPSSLVSTAALSSPAALTSPTTTPATTTPAWSEPGIGGALITLPAASPTDGPAPTVASSVAPSSTVPATIASTTIPEPTTTTPIEPVTEPEQLVALAMDSFRYDWQTRFPQWTVEVHGERRGIRALTYPEEKRIELFVRSTDTVDTLHRVLAHEIGHVVDIELNDASDRARWRDERGLDSSVPWWPAESSPDFATGAGDFAEAFAVWETGVRSQSSVAAQPDATDLEVLAELAA